jgi:hypothetical protein
VAALELISFQFINRVFVARNRHGSLAFFHRTEKYAKITYK